MDNNDKGSEWCFKEYLESLLKKQRSLELKTEYIVGDFKADYVICDKAGVPRLIFEVKNNCRNKHNDIREDIRSWQGKFTMNGKTHSVQMLLAFYDKGGWHFINDENEPVDILPLLQEINSEGIAPQKGYFSWFFVVGVMFLAVFLVLLFRPALCGCSCRCIIAPLTREMVTLLCAAGISFILPSILPYIKEIRVNGVSVVFTKGVDLSKKDETDRQ